MATILLSAAGAAIGSSVGGTLLGLSATAVGRFVGASLGRAIDQRLMGQGSEVVESGRVERFRLTAAGDGAPMGQVYGRMRVGGHVIWASEFTEHVQESGGSGGKGAPAQPKTRNYSYSVSLAIALCAGEITHVPRVWADGVEVAPEDLNMRVYTGAADQLPDPAIEAVEGAGQVPAYRGTAYVVLEDLALERFGNRVPQFSFEVTRPVQRGADGAEHEVAHGVQGVAMMPGTGEYALATEPVSFKYGGGKARVANVNSPSGKTDFDTSLDQMQAELPNCGATSLIVSWFGNDLRCGDCTLQPKVEQREFDGAGMPWRVAGIDRAAADLVAARDDAPVYGGTPADASVVQAIRRLVEAGQAVMFYPFILMDQDEGNTLPDPYSDADSQPKLPWRGRITLSEAPGRDGSPDGTVAAEAQVAAFFGTAQPGDFTVGDGVVAYSGPAEWSYRRFILHYAALCAAAGGVDSFCIGSEMRGLTQIRGPGNHFAAVTALRSLAGDVRQLLGPEVKIGYAADWSEYFGYTPQDGSGDRFFHLDPLWADPGIDFVGIDNYMPLSDWRDGEDHADAHWRSIYNPDYLRANIEGGEGYDWYYHSDEADAAQIRTAITDGAHDEPWVWRCKDIRNWWANDHHERIGGVRQAAPTAWEKRMKPVWFTEIGCAAIDKGTNQPNKFLDPKSSESRLPKYSDGRRDELMQVQYLRALFSYWTDPAKNPVSDVYGGPMIDMARCFVWAWDARPYPWFPGLTDLWRDGGNYARGHWLNGRVSGRTLASVVAEICEASGLTAHDVSALHGFVRGYQAEGGEGRAQLQALMLRYGFDAVERDGVLAFVMRDGRYPVDLAQETLALSDDLEGRLEITRVSEAEMSGRVRVKFIEADGDYEVLAEEAVLPEDRTHAVSATDLPIAMTRAEGREAAERWLAEARVAREAARFALPPSRLGVGPGDVVRLADEGALYRVDRVEQGPAQIVEAVRIDAQVYRPASYPDDGAKLRAFVPPVPVTPLFMDLPLIKGDEAPHAPHLAVTSDPWPGSVAVYASADDSDYVLNEVIAGRATVGVTESPLVAAAPGRIDNGPALQVRLTSGSLQSIAAQSFLAGGNLMVIGDGTSGNWELFQFREAELLAPDVWLLRHRLRGQAGSDGIAPPVWPVGSWVVALNGVPAQIPLAPAARGLARHYRIGPAQRGYDDPSYTHLVQAFDGNGLRPYRPAHLRAVETGGDLALSWIRRTRIDGDGWGAPEVPLGEESEAYLLRIVQAGAIRREVALGAPGFTYTAAMQAADAISAPYEVAVAQVSASYGPGPFAVLAV